MKTLNIFPPLASGKTPLSCWSGWKFASIRLGERTNYKVGEVIVLTTGWNKEEAIGLCRIIITRITFCRIKDLVVCDLIGENESIKLGSVRGLCEILGIIYREIVSPNSLVTVIQWEYLDSEES